MKNFLQMLYEFIPKVGIGFAKCLVAICMLVGTQSDIFAQVAAEDGIKGSLCEPGATPLTVTSGGRMVMGNQIVFPVQYGSDVVLTAPVFGAPTDVKWEKKSSKRGPWESVGTYSSNLPIELTNVTSDVLYKATVNGLMGPQVYMALVATAKISADVLTPCPKEAIDLKVDGAEFAYRIQWFVSNDAAGNQWNNEGNQEYVEREGELTRVWPWNSGDKDFAVKCVIKYDEFNCSRAAQGPRMESNKLLFEISSNCKSKCKTTSTGDYYVGTDFDPSASPTGKIPDGVEHHFGEYDIKFDKTSFNDYWLDTSTYKFFGQTPALDKGLPPGANHYLFCQSPNDNIVSLQFKAQQVKGMSYRYRMRMYVQFDGTSEKCIGKDPINAWSNARFIARTQHGNETHDQLEAVAYDNATNREFGSTVVDGDRINFADIIPLSELKAHSLVRIEVTFFGSFPANPNAGQSYFTFEPRFEQFECGKVALDYISAEIENVCLDPDVVCLGDYAKANAAGFPRNSTYMWERKEGDRWVNVDPNLNGTGDAYSIAEIKVNKLGKQDYRVHVTAAGGYDRLKEFVISGKDCRVPTPTGIDGEGVYCLPNSGGLGYKPNIIAAGSEVKYVWTLIDPYNSTIATSNAANSIIKPYTSKADSITIFLADDVEEGVYKLKLQTFNGSAQQGEDVVMPLYVYRTPDIKFSLVSDKYTGVTSETDKTLCPSDVRREIVATATNSFNTPNFDKYTFTWTSDPKGNGVFEARPSKNEANVHIEAIPGMCSGDFDNVVLSVTADIYGCKSTDGNRYGVEKPVDPTIDCSSLQKAGKDTFELPVGQKTMTIRIPFPEYDSGCDSDPDLEISYEPVTTGNSDLINKDIPMIYSGTIVVKKSELESSPLLNVTLPWGLYDFEYRVVNGCGRDAKCTTNIVIKKDWGPVIDCDSIIDIDEISKGTENNCDVIFDNTVLKEPTLWDENDKVHVTGTYAGRLHSETKQVKSTLYGSAADRAKFSTSEGLLDPYKIDYTYILWKFTNNANKSSYCVQEVWVKDVTPPVFDCEDIDPKVFRPETEEGECEIKFEDFWNVLKNKNYIAYDYCPEPTTPIIGELHEDPVNVDKVAGERVFHVGVAETIYWQFRDRHGNVKPCPQIINAKAVDSVKVNCDEISYREGLAKKGTCYADAADLDIPAPTGVEPCTNEIIYGVGTRSDGMGLDDPYKTGDTYIYWVFEGENSKASRCTTHVFVKGNLAPVVPCEILFPDVNVLTPDCDPMSVTLTPQPYPDPCVDGYMMISEPYLEDENGDYVPYTDEYKFPLGETFVHWIFWDYTHNVSDTCHQSVHLRDQFPPDVDCDTIPDSEVELDGVCYIPFEYLRDSLGKNFALEHCTRDTIWGEPYLVDIETNDIFKFPSKVSVGIYPIRWVFENDSLTIAKAGCDKTLYLRHNMEPIFDCESLKPLQLLDELGLCEVTLDPDLLLIPVARDACKPDSVYAHGYIQLFEKGEYIDLCYFDTDKNIAVYKMPVPLGGHKVKWVFTSPFSTKEKICYQIVKVNSDALDRIDCGNLPSYVHVTMREQGGASFQMVKDSGLVYPRKGFEFDDPCDVIDTVYTRNDGLYVWQEYPVGAITEITWLFKDRTENAEREKACHTNVEVQDGGAAIMKCPDLIGPFTCLEEIPAPYADFDDFISQPGAALVSNGASVVNFADKSTFKVEEKVLGDICADEGANYVRTYSVENMRHDLSTCTQKVKIKDDVAPVWLDNAGSLLDNKTFSCSVVNFFPDNLRASDLCQDDIFTVHHKVKELDDKLVDGIFYTVSSTKSDNPKDCNYYSYVETRKYIAVDRCRNRSNILTFTANVVDNDPPVVDFPNTEDWKNAFLPAVYAKQDCKFLYPDIISSFPKDVISDDCDNASVKYDTIYQKPEAGEVIKNISEKQVVTLYIEDVCGNRVTIDKEIFVQDRKDILTLNLDSQTVCIEKRLTLHALQRTKGKILVEDWFNPGNWIYVDNDQVEYDYYRGDFRKKPLDHDSLIYSNHGATYRNEFDQTKDAVEYIGMTDLSHEGYYTIVATDTVLQCKDTATAYITVHSSPTILMDNATLPVCENDSIHLISDNETLYDKYHVDVTENGEEITEEGWMINNKPYVPETLLPYADGLIPMKYYAINACGTGKSASTISIEMRSRMKPENLMLTTEPQDKPRVYEGESAKLKLVTKYTPEAYMWMKVKGSADGLSDEMFNKYGDVREEYIDSKFEQDSLITTTLRGESKNKQIKMTELGDSAKYYVLLIDSVCPAVPSNVVAIDVVKEIPTAFTPHNSIGFNDVFMPGHHVIIFNRYGQKMVESEDGWDGTCRDQLVDPGVYFYEVIINHGQKHKGSIEVVYFK